jgi:hypothetical protein
MAEAIRLGRINGTLRQPWRGKPVGTPWAAAVRVERDDLGRRVATFAAFVDSAGFALQDGVVLPPGHGDGPFEAAMAEAVKRLGRFCGLGRGNTRLLWVTGHEWLAAGEDRGGLWGTGVGPERVAKEDDGRAPGSA